MTIEFSKAEYKDLFERFNVYIFNGNVQEMLEDLIYLKNTFTKEEKKEFSSSRKNITDILSQELLNNLEAQN